MEMLQLRYFYESAVAESFSKTAQKYMVPASSVSACIRRLEQELGTELFIRTGNRVILNEKGKRFLEAVGNTLNQLDIAVDAISDRPAEKQTISILARFTRGTLARWIVRFYRIHPTVSFKLTFDDIPENYEKYDIIVSTSEEELADYESFSWRRFDVRVEALETDPLCNGPVTLQQLRDRQFVTTDAQKGSFKVLTQACERQGFTPKVFLECDDYECRKEVLASGVCLGLNLRNNADSRQTNMQFLDILDFKEKLDIYVYYKKESYEGNIKQFLDLLKTSAYRP